MSGWLPFEQHLKEILRYEDNPALAGHSYHETQPGDHDIKGGNISSDEESERDEFSKSELEDDPFQRPSQLRDDFNPFMEGEEEVPLPIQAINYVRDILDLPMFSTDEKAPAPSNLCQLQTPVFYRSRLRRPQGFCVPWRKNVSSPFNRSRNECHMEVL